MRAFWIASISVITALMAAAPAVACRAPLPLSFEVVDHADMIVVGRLSHYEFVADQAAWERQRRQLGNPDLPPEVRHHFERQRSEARFRISVSQTLRGEVPPTFVATLDDTVFETLFALAPSEYLIALVRREQQNDSDSAFSVLQSPCGPAFLFPANSAAARAVRERIAQ